MTHTIASEEILKSIECPECFEYMVGVISSCTTGHSLCSSCRIKVNSVCPVCEGAIRNSRNYSMENLVKNYKIPCQNEGCSDVLPAEELAKHRLKCIHKSYECILNPWYRKCDWKGRVNDVRRHVEDEHKDYLSSDFLKSDRLSGNFRLIIHNNRVFVVYKYFDCDNSYYFAYTLGDAENFNIAISYGMKNQEQTKVTFEVPCGTKYRQKPEIKLSKNMIAELDCTSEKIEIVQRN